MTLNWINWICASLIIYMRYITSFLFLLSCFTIGAQEIELDSSGQLPFLTLANEVNSWKELRSYEGRFRIVMPGEVEEKSYTLATDVGDLTYRTFYCQLPLKGSDNLMYMLSYVDYPEGAIHSDSIALIPEFFEATMDAAAQSVKGDLVYSGTDNYKGYPGRRWRIDYLRGSAVIKTRAVIVEHRYYAIQTITKKDKNLNLSTDKFFESFTIFVD